MNKERAKELLNLIISEMLVGNSVFDVIEQLLEIGFTKKELVEEFNFNQNDVDIC